MPPPLNSHFSQPPPFPRGISFLPHLHHTKSRPVCMSGVKLASLRICLYLSPPVTDRYTKSIVLVPKFAVPRVPELPGSGCQLRHKLQPEICCSGDVRGQNCSAGSPGDRVVWDRIGEGFIRAVKFQKSGSLEVQKELVSGDWLTS